MSLFQMFIHRMGLEADEASKVDDITSLIQEIRSWITIQASLRARGVKGSLTKGEAANVILQTTIDKGREISDADMLLLVKGVVAIMGFQYQENVVELKQKYFNREELLNKVDRIIDENKDELNKQYKKSVQLYNNRSWFEKMFG